MQVLWTRSSGRGGGVGMLVYKELPSPSNPPIILSYNDCISCKFNLQSNSLCIIVIYRPTKPAFSTFFDEFYDFINDCLHHNEYKVMIVDDFNYHFDSSSQQYSLFKQLTESISLHQHINCPTHVSGNIIDIIFTPIRIWL